ncbi:hypothetical protein BC829DRAFT_88396 [Chytridium lagenaria]|nr:hypothetical protein BC829DRAFT_88396 [Chytridium lagenaria]
MIPELSKLQKQYAHKDVYIASITFEEKLPVIQEFVLHLGPKIEYSLFWDSKQKAKTLLFDASKTKGIPFCMILNTENKIVWMGNPHDAKFREVLDKEAQNATDREPSTIKKAVQEKIKAAEKAAEKITEIPSAGDCEGDVCKVEKRVGRKVDEDN